MARGTVFRRPWKDGRRVSWAIKYRLPDGRQKVETVGPSKKQAERRLAARIAALDQGSYRELRKATFAEFAAKWLADYARPHTKPSTFDGYRRYLEGRWIPAFGGQPLTTLTTGQIQEEVARLSGSALSPKTINNYLVPLKLMLSHAVRWGYLAQNPAAAIERLKVEHQEMSALSPEQARRLLAAAGPEYRLFLELALLTGLRRGELLGLKWKDVDFAGGRLRVARAVWRGQFVTPKSTRSARMVDLAPSLLERLREARPAGPSEVVGERLIFPGPDGGPADPDRYVKRPFGEALARAGVPRIRFHDLRHTYATLLILAGEHPKFVQAQLGHASIQTTLDRYGHLLPGVYSHAGERIEATLWEVPQGAG